MLIAGVGMNIQSAPTSLAQRNVNPKSSHTPSINIFNLGELKIGLLRGQAPAIKPRRQKLELQRHQSPGRGRAMLHSYTVRETNADHVDRRSRNVNPRAPTRQAQPNYGIHVDRRSRNENSKASHTPSKDILIYRK